MENLKEKINNLFAEFDKLNICENNYSDILADREKILIIGKAVLIKNIMDADDGFVFVGLKKIITNVFILIKRKSNFEYKKED